MSLMLPLFRERTTGELCRLKYLKSSIKSSEELSRAERDAPPAFRPAC